MATKTSRGSNSPLFEQSCILGIWNFVEPIGLGGSIPKHRPTDTQVVHRNLFDFTWLITRQLDHAVFEKLDQVIRHVGRTLASFFLGPVEVMVALEFNHPSWTSRVRVFLGWTLDLRKTSLFARL